VGLQTDIETLLSTFWDKRAADIIDDPLSVDELGAPLDSISAVEAFKGIDKLVGSKLPVDLIIRHGGYSTKEQFVTEITSKVMKHVQGDKK
jgi:hypothetical protein